MIREWTSREGDESSYIKISNKDTTRVVEIEYVSALERMREAYKRSKDKGERRELKERYAERCREENKRLKREVYSEKI